MLSKPRRVPHAALKRVLEMAVDMSGESSYREHDEDGTDLGPTPAVERDLETVRVWLTASQRAKSEAARLNHAEARLVVLETQVTLLKSTVKALRERLIQVLEDTDYITASRVHELEELHADLKRDL